MSRVLTLFSRALRLRCPVCGGGPIFSSWFNIRESCPACDRWLERDEGYYTGAMALNLIVAEGIFIVGFVAALILTWPTPPWQILTWGGAIVAVLMPLLFYPFSKTLWIALDVLMHADDPSETHFHPDLEEESGRPSLG